MLSRAEVSGSCLTLNYSFSFVMILLLKPIDVHLHDGDQL